MTPKTKAKELIEKFAIVETNLDYELSPKIAKQSAIKCVDEIIEEYLVCGNRNRWEFWQSVRSEIDKL